MIDYPKLRQREEVELKPADIDLLQQWEREIPELVQNEQCPEVIRKPVCRNCSYNDFCYIAENE